MERQRQEARASARAAARADIRRRRAGDEAVISIDSDSEDSSSASDVEIVQPKKGKKAQVPVDESSDDESSVEEVEIVQPKKGGKKGQGKKGAAVGGRCVSLLDDSDGDEENSENGRRRGRKRRQETSAEAADRAMAERLQREFDSSAGGRSNNRHGGGNDQWSQYGGGRARGDPEGRHATRPAMDSDRAMAERMQREEDARRGHNPHHHRSAPPRDWSRLGERTASAAAPARPTASAKKRKEERVLKQQQDAEYEETLLADQMRDIEKREAEEKERREKREAEEKERREREEKEENEQMQTAREASALDNARAIVAKAPEPPTDAEGVSKLRFALPNGKKIDRRFLGSDTVATVRAYLLLHFHEAEMKMGNVGLTTSWPKKEYGEKEGNMTLEEAGLCGEMLMVQDLDA